MLAWRRLDAAATGDRTVIAIEALGYLDFLALIADARLVVTDSGGVQEEATVLGVPVLHPAGHTERPVTVTQGTNTLLGLDASKIATVAGRGRQPPSSGTDSVLGRERRSACGGALIAFSGGRQA